MTNVKKKSSLVILIISLPFLLLGCVTDRPITKKDLTTIPTLKVVRYQTPMIKLITLGRAITGGLLTFTFGPIAAMLYEKDVTSGENKTQIQIPDLGYLIMSKFVERAGKEIPNWPTVTVMNNPISTDFAETSSLLIFHVKNNFRFHYDAGLMSDIVATMKDSNGKVLWSKDFSYVSYNYKRDKSLKNLEADNYKLFKEEIVFASEKTVEDFIGNFKERVQE